MGQPCVLGNRMDRNLELKTFLFHLKMKISYYYCQILVYHHELLFEKVCLPSQVNAKMTSNYLPSLDLQTFNYVEDFLQNVCLTLSKDKSNTLL